MSIPNIDTFEHDISEEIKTKEATIGDIASSSGEIGNTPNQSSSISTFLIAFGILVLVAVITVAAVLFIKYSQRPIAVPQSSADEQSSGGALMKSISGSINSAIGDSIGTIQKTEYGYNIQLLSYSDVFAYMLKNEQRYADELAQSVGSPRDTSTTTPSFSFTDVTINNQNMRVGVSANSMVVYAFVNTKILLISSSTQGILSLRGVILP